MGGRWRCRRPKKRQSRAYTGRKTCEGAKVKEKHPQWLGNGRASSLWSNDRLKTPFFISGISGMSRDVGDVTSDVTPLYI